MARLLPALVVLCACASPLDADLLAVAEVGPEHLEPGTRVEIRGHGFPPGRDVRIELEGIMHAPGEEPEEVFAVTEGRAGSSEVIAFETDEALIDDLGGRGTFEGRVTIRVAADGGGVVSGRLDGIVLDLSPTVASEMDVRVGHRRVALSFARFLGVAPVLDDEAGAGFAVDGVAAGSPGDIAGIVKGDRIVAIDGVRIATLDDFVPRPDADSVTLEIARRGDDTAVPIVIDVAGYASPEPDAPWLLGAGLSAFALVVLLFFSPLSGATRRLVGVVPLRGPPSPTPWWKPRLRPDVRVRDRVRTAAFRVAGWLGAATALGVLPFSARIYTGGVDVAILLLVALAAMATSEALRTDPPRSSGLFSRGAAAASALGRVGWSLFRVGTPTVLAVAAVVVVGGTLRSTGIVDAQGGAVWDWYALRHPVGFVAFPAYVVAGLIVPSTGGRARSSLAAVARHISEFVLVGLGTMLFLGGWAVPFVAGDPLVGPPMIRLAAAAVFLAKAGLLLVVSRRIARGLAHDPWHLRLAGLAAAGSLAGAGSLLVFPPSAMLEIVSRPVLCLVVALVAVYAIARAVRRRPRQSGLRPFA